MGHWPHVVYALQEKTPEFSQTPANPQSCIALHNLYNLLVRPQEANIFAGLLSNWQSPGHRSGQTSMDKPATALPIIHSAQSRLPAATPWVNFEDLFGLTVNPVQAHTAPTVTNELAASDHELDKLLSSLSDPGPETPHDETEAKQDFFQLPTPETDDDTPLPQRSASTPLVDMNRLSRASTSTSHMGSLVPDDLANPACVTYPTPASSTVSAPKRKRKDSCTLSSVDDLVAATPSCGEIPLTTLCAGKTRPGPRMSLDLPNNAFVPPPPMCMFFHPNFRDLQKDKIGIWKGDLEIRGVGGGKWSILIIGEQATGNIW